MARFLSQAFHLALPDAKEPEKWYVSLVEVDRVYLGPEEGGRWGDDRTVVAFKEYPTSELAEAAAASIRKLAQELQEQAQRAHGKHCQESMEWLDARGLDADFLPEPDGPTTYQVIVSEEIPQGSMAQRRYE
jgi:hypothetical protein